MDLYILKTDTPVGRLGLVANQSAMVAVFWEKGRTDKINYQRLVEKATPLLLKAEKQLQEYFAGQRQEFDLPLEVHGTPFQEKVWQALSEIPYGTTHSYADVAHRVNSPRAVRAVGSANGNNPLPIIIPCHRVINKSGKLGGFGGGLDIKQQLLSLEQA